MLPSSSMRALSPPGRALAALLLLAGGTACRATRHDRSHPDVPVVCPAPSQICGRECVDVTRYESHCGSCDHVCAASETCANRVCVPPCRVDSDCHPYFHGAGVCLTPVRRASLHGTPVAVEEDSPCAKANDGTPCGPGPDQTCQAGACRYTPCQGDADCHGKDARCVEQGPGLGKGCIQPGQCAADDLVP